MRYTYGSTVVVIQAPLSIAELSWYRPYIYDITVAVIQALLSIAAQLQWRMCYKLCQHGCRGTGSCWLEGKVELGR